MVKPALDAHEQPSPELRAEWKAISRLSNADLEDSITLDDPRDSAQLGSPNGFRTAHLIPAAQIAAAFRSLDTNLGDLEVTDSPILYHPLLPDLLIAPSLVPPAVQMALLDRLLHRDLANPHHETNMHLHYELPYDKCSGQDKSFFSLTPDEPGTFTPKDPQVHKPLAARRVLEKRLHWVTLGGQYDWTNRIYPERTPPHFPQDLYGFLEALFPETRAEAAIVNLYSPGDTMMMHRDVSEESDKGLISLSIGCDGIFMIAPQDNDVSGERIGEEDGKRCLLLRLRSGDVIYMTKAARYAWHGVPKIISGTCPSHLENWPAKGEEFEMWKGWMQGKRMNLNVRQMRD